jgi:hypothetical protein
MSSMPPKVAASTKTLGFVAVGSLVLIPLLMVTFPSRDILDLAQQNMMGSLAFNGASLGAQID